MAAEPIEMGADPIEMGAEHMEMRADPIEMRAEGTRSGDVLPCFLVQEPVGGPACAGSAERSRI